VSFTGKQGSAARCVRRVPGVCLETHGLGAGAGGRKAAARAAGGRSRFLGLGARRGESKQDQREQC